MSTSTSNARDAIRAAVFGVKQRHREVTVAGVQIEVRQPSVEDILTSAPDEDRKAVIMRMLCDYCYVPGTEEKVFEQEDLAAIMAMPFGKDWQALNGAINDLSDLGTQINEAKGNSDAPLAA